MRRGGSAIELIEEKNGVSVYKSPNGTMRLWRPAPHVVATQISGNLDAGLEQPFIVVANQVVEKGYRYVAFHDWWDMTGYHSSVRESLTKWAAEKRRAGQLKVINILVRAKIVAMGVTVAGMVMGGSLDAFAEKPKFQALFERECKSDPERWRKDAA